MIQVFAALLLAVSAGRAQQSSPQPKDFSFTPVDLELLDKSNQLDKQFQKEGLVYNDLDTTKYITKVGQAVLPEGPELQNVHWQFFAMRDTTPNAFALPNGSIYVHTGLLAVLENEAQLASVLAHEETHVLNRHGYLENRSYRKKMATANILGGIASAGSFAGGAGGGASLMLSALMPSLFMSSVNGYSRELEREADLRAVQAMVDADYSAEEMPIVFKLLQQSHEVETAQNFYQDHPKLQDRAVYVSEMANSLHTRSAHPKIEADGYLLDTESAVRHDVELEIRGGRARTAVWVMEHVVKRDAKLAENFYELGEGYRGLGPHTPEPTSEELSRQGKSDTRKKLSKMTPQEYEESLLKTPDGQEAWKSNQEKAEQAYQKAIELSPAYAAPHRGLGFLFERGHQPELSAREFHQYLELAPAALDIPQIKRRMETMEKEITNQPLPAAAN
jgi:predicted Zn-dependent protease